MFVCTSIVDGDEERERRGGFALVCAQVEYAGGIYTKETKTVEVRRPAKDACACEEEDAEGKGKMYVEGQKKIIHFIIHCSFSESSRLEHRLEEKVLFVCRLVVGLEDTIHCQRDRVTAFIALRLWRRVPDSDD